MASYKIPGTLEKGMFGAHFGYISTKWLSKPYSTCILGGYLNSKFTSTESGCGPPLGYFLIRQRWEPFLNKAIQGTALEPWWTYSQESTKANTRSDHIFISQTAAGVLPSGIHAMNSFMELSDGHRLIGASFQVERGPAIQTSQRKPISPGALRKVGSKQEGDDIGRYQTALSEWLESQTIRPYSELTSAEAEQCLEALITATVKIGLITTKWTRKRWKQYRDGWSPTMLADQAHLHFIEYLRADLGNSRRQQWPHRTALRHIHQAAIKWERKINVSSGMIQTQINGGCI